MSPFLSLGGTRLFTFMRVSFHSFTTKKANSGALYFYSEASKLLASLDPSVATAVPHDIYSLLQEDGLPSLVRSLEEGDVLVSNIGPYAHLYHYLREAYGRRFSIVRDVRTSSWAGYLLQERLAGPLTRPGDLVLFPSEFCRQYFIRQFPSFINADNTAVCYPMAVSFPHIAREANVGKPRLRVGYIGRFEDDKNFGQVLDAFAMIFRDDRRASLHLAGAIHRSSRFRSVSAIQHYLSSKAVPRDRVQYYGQLAYKDIWKFFGNIDILLFLALSSVESLGRVLLESQHAGVPTVAAHYAAAAEIVPADNLLTPHFSVGRRFDSLGSFSFGTVRLDDVVAAAQRARVGDRRSEAICYQPRTYIEYVLGTRRPDQLKPLSSPTEAFIDAIRLSGDVSGSNSNEVLPLLDQLVQSYRRYNDNRLWPRVVGFTNSLMKPQGHALQRTLRLQRLVLPARRFEAVHAREHCWAAGYFPQVELAADALAQSSVASS